jgi:tetratricopeptide (TPR) repeat protein
MPTRIIYIFLSILLLWVEPSAAQKSDALNDPDEHYKTGLHLFNREKFGAATHHFNVVLREVNDPKNELFVNARFYIAQSAYILYNSDAEFLLKAFLDDFPESMHANETKLTLANWYYRKRKYKDAINWFNQIELYPLNKDEKEGFYFKRAVSFMNTDRKEEAINDFFRILDSTGPFAETANYYYAHLNYEKKNYQTSANTFKKLLKSDDFAKIAPYYIAQIFYLQGNYDSLLVYAKPLLENEDVQQKGEISRLIGEAYYRKSDFENALPYLEMYKNEVVNTSRQDKFQLGFAYYKNNKLDKAEKEFSAVDSERDSLSQAAAYFLADVYVKQERYNYAKNAFKKAASLKFDPIIEEDALFNYGRFAYITSNDPFNEAARAFIEYVEKYPKKDRAKEAYTYLINIYMRTGRFEEGLEELEKIENKDTKLKEAYQTLAFNRGVQLFKIREFEKALGFFDKAAKYPVNKQLNAEAIFWKADTYYQLNENLTAADTWGQFLKTNGAFISPLYNLAYYNAGYALYREKKYKEASVQFRQFTARPEEKDSVKLNDATLRIADFFYLQKEYDRAIENYLKAINYSQRNVDYAFFQTALSHGFSDNTPLEQSYFQKVIDKGQNSNYYLDARFRLGNSFLRANQDNKALHQFNKIVEEYPNSAYIKRSLLQIGLIHSRANNNQEALAAFKKVVEDFPSDQDTKDALNAVKAIYVSMGNIEDFNQFVAGRTDFSRAELDSANYMAAEQRMFQNQPCNDIVDAFSMYLSSFENAIFQVNARYYRAECLARLARYEEALEDYIFVTDKPVNNFSEPAFFAGATLAFEQEDFNLALNLYQGLEQVAEFRANVVEAQIGQMRCYFKIENYEKAIEYAEVVIEATETPNNIKQEAEFTIAKSLLAQNQLEEAKAAYNELAEKYGNRTGAESLFKVAEITYLLADYEEVEEIVFSLIQQFPTFDLFKVKGLILLAESYIELGDEFQAKATLESIIEFEENLKLLLLPKDAETLLAKAKALITQIEESQQKGNETIEKSIPEIDIKSEEIDQREMQRIFNQNELEEIEALENSARESLKREEDEE